jgi:hypothetical protein
MPSNRFPYGLAMRHEVCQLFVLRRSVLRRILKEGFLGFVASQGGFMLANAHKQHAESLEQSVAILQQNPATAIGVIEDAWGAAYHWIAYGCIQKHNQHRDHHQRLAAYLDGLGESTIADRWRNFEDLRQKSFYGNQYGPAEIQKALDLLQEIKQWATT